MTIRKRLILAAALASLLTFGCASHTTPRHDAPYGISPTDYERTVRRYLEAHLHFPAEARMEVGEPRKGYMNKGAFLGGDVIWVGYLVDVFVQSIDRGFRREERYVVRIRNNEVVEAHSKSNAPPLYDL
jgi:hypothetical protein